MGYCITTGIGFVLGASCVIMTLLFANRESGRGNTTATPILPQEDYSLDENTKEQEQLKKQFANFFNYDGTVDSQVELGGE